MHARGCRSLLMCSRSLLTDRLRGHLRRLCRLHPSVELRRRLAHAGALLRTGPVCVCCVCVCVCVCVFMYACMYVCMYMYTRTHIHTQRDKHGHADTQTHRHTDTQTDTHTHTNRQLHRAVLERECLYILVNNNIYVIIFVN
jgi:hypothetical protein